MTTHPQSNSEQTPEPCPLPEPMRSLAQEVCDYCRTGYVNHGHGNERVEAPYRSERPTVGHALWRHRYYGYGYNCEAWLLFELNFHASLENVKEREASYMPDEQTLLPCPVCKFHWNMIVMPGQKHNRNCPHRDDAEKGCACQGCGNRYKVDVQVSDDLWNRIKPEGKPNGAGLLCGPCIFSRIEALGEFDRLSLTRGSANVVAPTVANFQAWTSIDQWLREHPDATAAECLAELVKRIQVEAAVSTVVPVEQSDDEAVDVRIDRAYIAGMKHGWNCRDANDNERFQATIKGRYADIHAAAAPFAATQDEADPLDSEAVDRELRRWQDAIRNRLIELGAPDWKIDGAGCDSGDPLDLTLAEVGQGVGYFVDQFEQLRAAKPSGAARAAVEKLKPYFTNDMDAAERAGIQPATVFEIEKIIESCLPTPAKSVEHIRFVLAQILNDLPTRRDWLDPALEQEARELTAPTTEEGAG